jgi:PAS domain S-box-containing protein
MVEPLLQRVLDTGAPILEAEVHGVTAAAPGVRKDWLVSCYRLDDRDGGPLGICAVVQEITGRKEIERMLEDRVERRTAELVHANEALHAQIAERWRAEESLRRSEERYRNLVENISEALFSIDADGRVTYVSPALARMTGGYTPEDVIGRLFHEFMFEEDRESVAANFRRALLGSPKSAEYRIRGKDGATYWLRSHSTVRIENGKLVTLQGLLTDVTEQRRAEIDARQHRAELAHVQRLTTAGAMTAEIAHQINQPLAAIVNFAGGLAVRLRSGHVQPEAMCRIANRIGDEARRAGEVIRQMREFLRTGKGVRCPCDLNRLVGRVYGLLEEEFQRGGIEVRLLLLADLPEVHAEPILIEQVILNLLRNALEAMAGSHGRHWVEVATRATDDSVSLTVRDTGVGLPAGAEQRVFDPFFTTKDAGLGLGLSVSRSIVEACGGRLWAEPSDGRGTVVGLSLPLGPPE